MGSQTLEILRQGVWASLTGGWFYDPHQNVFCNAVHLYLWLFLLCAPFVTYLYFPKTIATWGIYCVSTALLMTTLKVINMALHVLYDKSQAMSDGNSKKPLKGLKENEREDECGVEMQVLGASTQSAISVEQQSEENSGENSLLSIECQENVSSIIDLKVDVHRKNSSESSDSSGLYPVGTLDDLHMKNYRTDSNHSRVNSKIKGNNNYEDKTSKNLAISEEEDGASGTAIGATCIYQREDKSFDDIMPMQRIVDDHDNILSGIIHKKDDKKSRKSKTRLQRQNSLDVTTNTDLLCEMNNPHVSLEVVSQEKLRKIALIATRLQRYRSSENNEEYHMRNRNIFLSHHQSQSGRGDMRRHLKSLASDSYLENNYAKSDLSIENIEKDSNKMYLLLKQQKLPMRKDSNSTMSALQLPIASGNSCNSRKRRHSNTGCKSSTNQMSCVRRIKSTALDISCQQASVSNLSPHPNSAEAIGGEQIKNPQNSLLPPPSKSLVRNPHLNLCPKLGSFSSNLNGGIVEPIVYPIAEQADEKSIHESCMFTTNTDSDGDDEDDHDDDDDDDDDDRDRDNDNHNSNDDDVNNDETGKEVTTSSRHQRCSTTESESDLERIRTQSTDSETDNNGSRSPLLYKTNRPINDKLIKNINDENTHKMLTNPSGSSSSSSTTQTTSSSTAATTSIVTKTNVPIIINKNGDSGCPSSDCDQASASSKDMLLVKEKSSTKQQNLTDNVWLDLISDLNVNEKDEQKNDKNERKDNLKRIVKDPKHLGAIPKTTIPLSSSTSATASASTSAGYGDRGVINGTIVSPPTTTATTTSSSLSTSTLTTLIRNKNDDDFIDTNPQHIPKRNLGAIPKSTSRASSSASSKSYSIESFEYCTNKATNDLYRTQKDQWIVVNGTSHNSTILPSTNHNDIVFNHFPRHSYLDTNFRFQPKLRRSSSSRRQIDNDLRNSKTAIETNIPTAIEFGIEDIQNSGNTTLSIQGLIHEQYSIQKSSSQIRRASGAVVNIGRVEFSEPVYCDYWRPQSLYTEKQSQPKRLYKYPLKFFGRRELKIAMDRLQLLALFDRDLNWFHVILAILLSIAVCCFGSIILQMGLYKDIFAFIFCIVIAGSQYSLLKSVQPDAASPIHGFNKTVAYSRPIYFCLCSCILVFSYHLAKEFHNDHLWLVNNRDLKIYGQPFSPEQFFNAITKIMSILLLLFPIFFSLGLFPQINTFFMYILEQIDMHIFGGSAACSLLASLLCVFKSFLAVCLLYGPAFGGLIEQKGTQHILFSIFCALLIPVAYHLSRSASDFTHLWALIKSSLVSYPDDDDDDDDGNDNDNDNDHDNNNDNDDVHVGMEYRNEKNYTSKTNIKDDKPTTATDVNSIDECKTQASMKKSDSNLTETDTSTQPNDIELPDPLPKKLQNTVNSRLKNDLVVSSVLAVVVLGLHCSTIFTLLQPDLNTVLYTIAGILGFLLHYIVPQLRKHLPWLCFAHPVLRPREYGRFEVTEAAKVMWFENIYVCLCFLERNVLYPLIFISALTADSQQIIKKYGAPFGTAIVSICGLKCVRSAYSDSANQYLILIFSVLLFQIDFHFASETFLVDYFFVSIIFKKSCEFLLKMQFIVTYIAPWQITWGSAFHAFAQPFSVPHSAMLFLQAAISAILSTPLNPFLGSAIFLTSYVRPIKFWERDYNTRRIDHSNTRLSSQLERDLGADDNNLNSIFYEHLTRSLQHSLCGDLLLGRWGNVNQGDCFVLASDYLNCLVHIIELGNGLCTFQMRGLEFRGTYCQQREVEAISEGVEKNTGCCCCSIGHLPQMLSANAMFSTRWLAWQVVADQYVLEGYSITENLATATLQVFEFRKVLITYYIKSIIYYTIRNPKLNEWLEPGPIQDALAHTLNRQFVDLDPIFNYNIDEDFDFRALGITRTSFCSVYMPWIQFCYLKRMENCSGLNDSKQDDDRTAQNRDKTNSGLTMENNNTNNTDNESSKSKEKDLRKGETTLKPDESNNNNNNHNNHNNNNNNNSNSNNSNNNGGSSTSTNNANVTKDSPLISLCLALGLLARRSLATATHSSLSGVEFFLHGLHALFKGDFRITSPRDEWVFGDMELLHGVVAPAVKMALKLHQDHFSSPDEYLDPIVLYDAISTHSKDLVISHEADPVWRSAVLRGAPNLLALRHVMEDGTDEYRIIRLTKRFLSFRVIKLNRECVRGLWAGQQQELIYLRNRNPERGSIQNAKQALRNIINSSCDQPIGYPIYVSPLITSYAETNEQLCRIIGGSVSLEKIRSLILECWGRIRQRCREGCSSGSGGIECDTINDTPGVYFSPATPNNTLSGTAGTPSYGSQSLSGAGTRGSLACINKPTSSTLLAGLLNRERDQDRESIRDRPTKRGMQTRAERERRATLPITTGTVNINVIDSMLKDVMGSTNSGLKQLACNDTCIPNGNYNMNQGNKMSTSSGNLGALNSIKPMTSNMKQLDVRNSREREEFLSSESLTSSGEALIELNKKVIIVDGMEIYDCLDLGRRIDVVWPNEQMRSSGGRSSWKDWSPQEGMVGFVVHYWQPNHPDQRFRSNVNRILYLVEIGDHFVPVGESGIKEYNQIIDTRTTGITTNLIKNPIPINIPNSSTDDSSPNSSNIDTNCCNDTNESVQYKSCDNNDDDDVDDDQIESNNENLCSSNHDHHDDEEGKQQNHNENDIEDNDKEDRNSHYNDHEVVPETVENKRSANEFT